MKTPTSIIFILLALLVNCSKDEAPIPECKVIPYFDHLSTRIETSSLKGTILFSWREGSSWYYSIVPNLNIAPAQDNVCEGNTTTGADCLKKSLGFLAEGEELYWGDFGSIETIEGKTVKLKYPPQYIMNDIAKFCEEINLNLIIVN